MKMGYYRIAKTVFYKFRAQDVVINLYGTTQWSEVMLEKHDMRRHWDFFELWLDRMLNQINLHLHGYKWRARLGDLNHAQRVHMNCWSRKELSQVFFFFLSLALIDNDSKCSKIQTTKEIFDSVQRSNVCIWNWMINGLAVHELARDTIKVFTKMAAENVLPDSITFLGVLTACSHCGAVTEGHKYFDLMRNRYSIMESLWIHGRSSGSSWACRR